MASKLHTHVYPNELLGTLCVCVCVSVSRSEYVFGFGFDLFTSDISAATCSLNSELGSNLIFG